MVKIYFVNENICVFHSRNFYLKSHFEFPRDVSLLLNVLNKFTFQFHGYAIKKFLAGCTELSYVHY